MGADMLVSCFSEPMDNEFKPDWDAARKWIEDQSAVWIKTDTLPREIDWMGDPEDAGKQLLGYLETVQQAYEAGSRELTSLEFPPYRIHLTGGMSWGDDPSELFQPINILNELNLLDMCGFNTTLNYKKIVEKMLPIVEDHHPLLIGLDPDLDALLEKEFKNGKKLRKRKAAENPKRSSSTHKKSGRSKS